ncbi:hypothetical protein B5C34_12555 [Pacificimonas flava]|uniref:Phytoene synthase n=2 Tax=Pacificimonas TaxID=1960290 RepID=A0A219B765_9SPHN|nr:MULTISPECIES: squalene/phytoene synthase family protein [Pacificimonas]MBZ6378503.1 hypothetical protein [Pacificimonas aurantium]OWV34205.1 hypothetical protein B5C34_12555 [Pacificimonas flava]
MVNPAPAADGEEGEWLRDMRFALAFAPAAHRPALEALLRYDRRLLEIAPKPEEPHVPMIRLAWWRDTLSRLAEQPVSGEPLLERIDLCVPDSAYPALGTLAEAHMDRVEEGDEETRLPALFTAAAAITGSETSYEGQGRVPKPIRPIGAAVRAGQLARKSPTRRQLAMMRHILTGHLPTEKGDAH